MKFYENIPKSICPYSPDEDDKGKDKPIAKQVKLAQKARKPQAAKNGPKKAHPCDQCKSSFKLSSDLKRHIDTNEQNVNY